MAVSCDKKVAGVFMRHNGRTIRHLQKHQDISMQFWYYDTEYGREFDIRELPGEYLGEDRTAALMGDSEAHKRVIGRAIQDNHDFKRPKL